MRTLLAALLCAPCVAIAQQSEAPTPPPAGWSVGAGVSMGDYVFVGSPYQSVSGQYPSSTTAGIPAVVASLERAIGDRTWLLLGIAASAQVNDYDSSVPESSTPMTLHGEEYERGAIELGLRGVVTPADAPVAVSWLGSVQAGLAFAKANVEYAGAGSYRPRSEARYLAGTLGLAVERALGDRLAVRVATPLVRVFYSDAEQRGDDPSGSILTEATTSGLAAVIAPRLELRVFF